MLIKTYQPELNNKPGKGEKVYIQFAIEASQKADLERWCAANSTTMSEVIKKVIAPYVAKGDELRKQEVAS